MNSKTNAQPDVLSEAMTGLCLSIDNLAYSQLILVIATASDTKIRCYDKDAHGIWRFYEPIGIIKGFTGKNGVRYDKREGDGCSPAGLYRLGYAFGIKGKPETTMAYRKVSANSFWVDDQNSRHYNTWVDGKDNADWVSAEHLTDYPREYAYAVVIEYNTAERIPGKGSAVFLHCGSKPTSGCVAVPEAELLLLLKWLRPDKTPGILIESR